jgi:hypothetical protein
MSTRDWFCLGLAFLLGVALGIGWLLLQLADALRDLVDHEEGS